MMEGQRYEVVVSREARRSRRVPVIGGFIAFALGLLVVVSVLCELEPPSQCLLFVCYCRSPRACLPFTLDAVRRLHFWVAKVQAGNKKYNGSGRQGPPAKSYPAIVRWLLALG